MPIRPDTGTLGIPTKVDHEMALAGCQVINGGIVDVEVHLPYSPAQGAPLHDTAFIEGEDWAEVQGAVHSGTGPLNQDQ